METIIGNAKLVLGDGYKYIKSLDSQSIDLLHIDPPYEMPKLNSKGMGKYMTKVYSKSIDKLADPNIINGFDFSCLPEILRVLKTINIQVWCNKRVVFTWLKFAEDNGYNWQDISLFRTNALPNVQGKYQDKDYCIHIWKGRTLTGNYKNKSTAHFYTVGDKQWAHPALKPLQPVMDLIEVGSSEGDTVLDLFMGSGTVGEACTALGRKYIGVEIQKKYFDLAVHRLGNNLL